MSSLQLLTGACAGGVAAKACRRPTAQHGARSASSLHQHTSSRARRVSCRTALDSIDGFTPITKRQFCTVSDVMTSGTIICCSPNTTIDEALELLVQHRITGLPVVNDSGVVVGVVSDYDLLALDTLGRVNDDQNLFPEAEQTWQAFKEVKTLLAKTGGKRVADVMTKSPITVTPECDLDRAARILLSKKIRRLPVISQEGVLRGIISRSNIVKAALESRRAALASMEQQ